jgi:hypothetical protein
LPTLAARCTSLLTMIADFVLNVARADAVHALIHRLKC